MSDSLFRLLCMDDDIRLLQTLASGFQAYGIEGITATHGIDALIQYRVHTGKFDAILTDNDMPKMNGLAFVKQARGLG